MRTEDRDSRQKSQPPHPAARSSAVAPLRVGQRFAQHLKTSAYAEDHASCLSMPENPGLKTILAEPKQIIQRVFCPGKDNKIRLSEILRSFNIAHTEIRVSCERRDICEIGYARETYYRNVDRAVMASARKLR